MCHTKLIFNQFKNNKFTNNRGLPHNFKKMRQKLLPIILIVFLFSLNVYSQKTDSTKAPIQFSGNISATNNGVSLVPTFSLGKPAILIDLAVKGKKLSFEPMLNFATDKLKPWGFIFWLRYKLVEKKKFKIKIGAHPSFVFSASESLVNGIKTEKLTANRYVAFEFVPSYQISKNTTVSAYLLGANQLAVGILDPTYFVAVNAISTVNLSDKFFMRMIPQLYFLKLGNQTGYYTNANVIIGKKNFPISINGMVSKSIKTEIEVNKFVWSAGLTYSF